MKNDEIEILKRALKREKASRQQAEKILETKSAELYQRTQELRDANEQLKQLVSRQTSELKGIFDNIVDAYVVMDLHGNVIKMNDPAAELLEFSMEDGILNLNTIVHSEEMQKVLDYYAGLFKNGSLTDAEIRIKTRNGNVKLVHINASMIYDQNEVPLGAQGIVRDITISRESQKKLIESESRLSKLIANLDSGVLLEDENRLISTTNQQFCDLFRIPVQPELLVGQDCSNAAEQSKELFKNPEEFVKRINTLLKDRKTVLAEEVVMADGTILERDYIPIFVDELYKGHLWTYRDVTLKRKYRESIDAQRQKYSNIIANMNLGLLEVDNDDIIQSVNHSFVTMSGFPEDQLIGKKASDLLLDEPVKERLRANNDLREKGESNSYEIPIVTKNGEQKYWLISGAPNYNINGETIGSIGIHLDITEMKELEIQKENLLKKLEKSNEELEEYAHVVSHDLKSPLRSLYALIDWLKEDNEASFSEESLSHMTLIESTLEKMEMLISNVLTYSSIDALHSQETEVDLNLVVKQVSEILHPPGHIELTMCNELPIVLADPTRMQQLFQNLISNAIRYNDKDKGWIKIDHRIDQGKYLFSIQDNGVGIEDAYKEKIFDMFQHLDQDEKSTGIGLSIVKRIVELYEGRIWLESTPGEGSTFYFTLPIH